MTDRLTTPALYGLLDRWVTVTNPEAPHQVWYGRLAGVWDRPSIVLETPGGGREQLPATFNIQRADPADAPRPGAGQSRPWHDLHASGLLWLINRTAFHPRGVALAVHTDKRGAFGWSLMPTGDREPDTFDPEKDSVGYERAEATLAAAGAPEHRLLDCGLCFEEHGEEVHPHPECGIGKAMRRPEGPADTHDQLVELIRTEMHSGRGPFAVIPRIANRILEAFPDIARTAPPDGQEAAALARVRAIPRLPHLSQQTGELGRAYTRGWESVIAAVDAALEPRPLLAEAKQLGVQSKYPADAECCVCGGGPVVYDNYKDQLFCWRCADCDCGRDGPCIRTDLHRHQVWDCIGTCTDGFHGLARCERHHNLHPNDGRPGLWHEGRSQDGSTLFWKDGDPYTTPGTSPDSVQASQDTRPDTDQTVRTDETPEALTSTDTVQTECPDTVADNPDGIRFAYTARVPRRQMGAAFMEAFGLLAAAKAEAAPTDDDRLGRPENAHARLGLAREVLIDDGYFTDDEIGPDLAPRLTEWLTHHRGLKDQAEKEVETLRSRVGELAGALADILGRFTESTLVDGALAVHVRASLVERWRRIHTGNGPTGWAHPHVQGICPTCRDSVLILGSGGYVTCSAAFCTNPDAPGDVLANAGVLATAQERANRYAEAYEWLRTDVNTAARYIQLQKDSGPLSPFRNSRPRILATLPNWIKDPGPLDPATPKAEQ